MIIIIKKKYS